MLSRRQLLGLGGSVAVLASCGGGSEPRRRGRSEAEALDLKLVGSALDLEHTVIGGAARRATRTIAEQEREHAGRLEQAVRALGGRPNPPKTREEYARAFPRLREGDDALRFAVDLENAAVRFYLESLPKLTSPALRRLAGAIATNEAQHAAVLRGELGRPQAPDAFVTGRSQVR